MNRHKIERGSIVEDYAGRRGTVLEREQLRLEGSFVSVIMDNGEKRHYRPRQLTHVDGAMRHPAE